MRTGDRRIITNLTCAFRDYMNASKNYIFERYRYLHTKSETTYDRIITKRHGEN
jgi:hypothetical protein